MRNLRRLLGLVLVSLFCVLFVAGCDDVISDPNFHTWCGDQLCSWKLESGEIRKAPTWHKKDFGVELLDSNAPNHVTAISQRVDKTPTCLEFSVIADVAAEAQVSIGVDFGADGTFEYEQPIAATGFREQKTQVTAPLHYVGIKFVITKKGSGRAVLAQMDVKSRTDCTAPPVVLRPQIMGTKCYGEEGASCLSGTCCKGVCSECCPSRGPARYDGDGGLLPDLENKCAGGVTCGTLPLPSYDENSIGFLTSALPHQCEPGKARRPGGAECLLDDDCTSERCDGPVWTIRNMEVDGGACPPPPAVDPACIVTSVHAGRCQ